MLLARLGHVTRGVISMTQAEDRTRLQAAPAVITLPEEIDMASHLQAGEQLGTALRAGHPAVIADLSRTVFCDSAGIRVLCRAHQEATSRGTELRFVVAQPGVLRVLQISGADQVLPIYPTLQSAHAGNSAPRQHPDG
jgi:anti-anti-sigma factor